MGGWPSLRKTEGGGFHSQILKVGVPLNAPSGNMLQCSKFQNQWIGIQNRYLSGATPPSYSILTKSLFPVVMLMDGTTNRASFHVIHDRVNRILYRILDGVIGTIHLPRRQSHMDFDSRKQRNCPLGTVLFLRNYSKLYIRCLSS